MHKKRVTERINLDSKVDGNIWLDVAGAKAFKCKAGLIKSKNGVMIIDNVNEGV